MKSGIYRIRNTVDNKSYIGSSIHIETRWKQHKWKLNNSSHYNKNLQSAWHKYYQDSFEFTIIEECSELLFEIREAFWINYYNSMIPNGYNLCPAQRINGKRIISEETKKKISEACKGRKLSLEHLIKRQTSRRANALLRGKKY